MLPFKLDPITFQSTDQLGGYTSFIWTERYLAAGDFEIKTPFVTETLALLPEDSLLGIKESREVMIVETHEIETDNEGQDILVVKGRSYETVLEDRFVRSGTYGEKWKVEHNFTAPQMAMALTWNAVSNTISQDILKTAYTPSDPAEIIPNVGTSLSIQTAQVEEEWWVQNGPIYQLVQDFMAKNGGGVRNIRPPFELSPPAFDATMEPDGSITPYPGLNDDKLRIDFYTGVDRTVNQTDRPQVVLNYRADHLETPKYLFSTKGMKNVAWVHSSLGDRTVGSPGALLLQGRLRRMLFVDGGTLEVGMVDWAEKLDQLGAIELAKYNRTQAINTGIAVTSPYKYGRDYNLGDKLTVVAGYGYQGTMMVNEYMRSEDSNGEHGVPTLILG